MEQTELNLITAGSRFEGTVEFDTYTRFDGYIRGVLKGRPGSQVIVGDNGVVEGNVEADTVIIDGFVRGNVIATTKVVISETGRVIGAIQAPSVGIKFGGYFDGKCAMPLKLSIDTPEGPSPDT